MAPWTRNFPSRRSRPRRRDRAGRDGPQAERLRAALTSGIAGSRPRKGGILEALRRSPLVGADAVPPRPFEPGREVDL